MFCGEEGLFILDSTSEKKMMEYCVQDAEMAIQKHKGTTSLTHILSH